MAELENIRISLTRPLTLGSGANARSYKKGVHMVSEDKVKGWAIPSLIRHGDLKILSNPAVKVVDEEELTEVIFGDNGGIVNGNVDKMLDSFFSESPENNEEETKSSTSTTVQDETEKPAATFNKLRRPNKRKG